MYIFLTKYFNCSFSQKAENVQRIGAIGMIVSNTIEETFRMPKSKLYNYIFIYI